MIVIVTRNTERTYHVKKGYTLNLIVESQGRPETVIVEHIRKDAIINFVASFCFAHDDGTVPALNLCGFFGDKDHLPPEILTAKTAGALSPEQRDNFARTSGLLLL